MSPVLTTYLIYNAPILVAFLWAALTSLQPVVRLLMFYAKVHFITVTLLFAHGQLVDWLCLGSVLKGYVRRDVIPVGLANLTWLIFLVSLACLAVFALFVVIICAARELGNRKTGGH